MTRSKAQELVLSLQADSGAFQSIVHRGEISVPDYNGFVTALVLRDLEPFAGLNEWKEPIERALAFLAECESPGRPGFFFFWPLHRWPVWFPRFPEDADDTAVMASELLHYRKIDLERARSIASALTAYRLETAPSVHEKNAPQKNWVRAGAFLTWLDHRSVPNQIDCTVNANVAALLAQTGLTSQSGYAESCQTILGGISYCAGRWECLEQLSPYYPEPVELTLALQNAVRKGASELRAGISALEQFPGAREARNHPANIVFSADRGTLWSSLALWAARQMAGFRKFRTLGCR
jgi:hypothetical protein